MSKFDQLFELLKQPSTVKGLLGLTALVGLRFGEGQYNDVVDGLLTIYLLIAIFWQKS